MTDLDTGKTMSLQKLKVSTLKIQGDTYTKYILDVKLPKSVRASFSLVQFRENLPAKFRFRRAF
jgi:hypothetical protein